jgi:ECF sigma factor
MKPASSNQGTSNQVASNQVTELLARWSKGEDDAREKLVPLVYDELRQVARRCLASQPRDQTL